MKVGERAAVRGCAGRHSAVGAGVQGCAVARWGQDAAIGSSCARSGVTAMDTGRLGRRGGWRAEVRVRAAGPR